MHPSPDFDTGVSPKMEETSSRLPQEVGNLPSSLSGTGQTTNVGQPFASSASGFKTWFQQQFKCDKSAFEEYFSSFMKNIYQSLNASIQRQMKKAKESAKKMRDVIEGRD